MAELPTAMSVDSESQAGETPAEPDRDTVSPLADIPLPSSIYGRRSHKKSRTGCRTCKIRKIKCDERHPACLNCISHGVSCPFLTPDPEPTGSMSTTSTSTSTTTASSTPRTTAFASPLTSPFDPPPSHLPAPTTNPPTPTPDDDALPLFELELLHNFTVHTYLTLASDAAVRDFWRVNVVEIGLECGFIMRALLAVSALHLACMRPARRDFYTAQGIVFHQRASREAMARMGEIRGLEDALNLFVFSVLTIYFALASPRRQDGYFFVDEAGLPDWPFLLGGAKSLGDVMDVEVEHDRPGRLQPFLAYGYRRWTARTSNTPSSTPSTPSLQTLYTRVCDSVTDPCLLRTYAFAIGELDRSLLASRDPGTPRDVLDAMIWIWSVSDSLVPLLKVPAQEAVAIFAHFCILLKHHESQWFLQGWADHLVSRAYDILDEEHRPWISPVLKEMGWGAICGVVGTGREAGAFP